ncbi:MAG: ShlB/FhaC/HecB family hemolysin secretion/activation protein [Vulcanimicrobiota bacterium]
MFSLGNYNKGLIALLLLVLMMGGTWAQSLTPDTNSPLDDPVQVKVKQLVLEGNESLDQSVFADILTAYEGRLLSFEDIRRVAEAIVTRYREHDFLTVSAYLPEQDLNDGVVTIQVIEAQVGEVSVEGAKHYDPEFVKWMFEPALDRQDQGDMPRRSEIQRQLLLLNDYMDLNVRSVLRESTQEGKVDMILQVQDKRPLHFGIDYNNLGASSTGRHRLGASVEWGNLSNRGDVLNFRYVESGLLNAGTKGIDLFTVGYVAPLNNRGTSFDFSYANSAFQVGQELQILDIRGDADVFRTGINHRLIRATDANLDISAGFVYQDIENTILGQRFSRDKLREFTLGLTGDWASGKGRNYGSLFLTQDLGSFLGGMDKNDPLSSRGVGGGFTKLKLDLSRVQRVNDFSYLVLRGGHQTAFSGLPYAEQFGLGGISTVRGFEQSVYLGDTGYNLSAEVRFAPIEDNRQLFEIGAFIDYGHAALKNPIPGELPNASLAGTGMTMQFRLPEHTYIRADLGWPIYRSRGLANTHDGPVPYIIFSKRF